MPIVPIDDRIADLSKHPANSRGGRLYRKLKDQIRQKRTVESLQGGVFASLDDKDDANTPLVAWNFLQQSDELINKPHRHISNVMWNFQIPGHDDAIIIIKPVYRKITVRDRSGTVEYGKYQTLFFDNCHEIALIHNNKPFAGVVDHSDNWLAITGPPENTVIVRDFYYAFAADPLAIFSMESNRCCLCQSPLKDAKSIQRGIDPECFRKFGMDKIVGR
ncbi:MAG: hypothetical protein QG599_176 [Pseudomonadota bacterium]|nr:hypothetical protein [Pseudomonadota bacterium]